MLKNTKESYGIISKFFHWTTALIILVLILVGVNLDNLSNTPFKFEVIALHKSFGLLVLWLVGLRIVWNLITKKPDPNLDHARWEKILAKITHLFLYAAMIGMPLSGWLMSSAGEYPVPFFGLQMPDLVGKNPDLAGLMRDLHGILGNILIAVILLHAAGALKHHFIDKDLTLTRMMANKMRERGPYIIIIILSLFVLALGAINLLGVEEELKAKGVAQVSENIIKDPALIKQPYEWIISQSQSRLNFRASVYEKEFTGNFPDFSGRIIFNPDDLKNSEATIKIDLRTLSSGDSERDQNLMTSEWFDTTEYPMAYFKASSFEKKEDNQYIAIGNLTIKDQTMPLILPFQLDIVEQDDGSKRAFVEGSANLSRLDYGLGAGRWERGDTVALDVNVDIKLTATLQ